MRLLCPVFGACNSLCYKCQNNSVKVSNIEDKTNLSVSHGLSLSVVPYILLYSWHLWLQSGIHNSGKSIVCAIIIVEE